MSKEIDIKRFQIVEKEYNDFHEAIANSIERLKDVYPKLRHDYDGLEFYNHEGQDYVCYTSREDSNCGCCSDNYHSFEIKLEDINKPVSFFEAKEARKKEVIEKKKKKDQAKVIADKKERRKEQYEKLRNEFDGDQK